MNNTPPRSDDFQKGLGVLAYAGTMGLHLVSGPAVGFGIGWALDAWLGSDPWMKAVFFFVGIIAGFKSVYEDAKKLTGETRKKRVEDVDPQA